MAGVRLYGRGQDAPRQSGSEPSPYRELPEVQANTTWDVNVPRCEVVVRPHIRNDVFDGSLLVHIKPAQGVSMCLPVVHHRVLCRSLSTSLTACRLGTSMSRR